MQVVTAGWPYLDIDAYAGIVAYAELLNKSGVPAIAVSTAPLNESIPASIQGWEAGLITSYQASNDDRFTIIDLSDPKFVDKITDIDRISQVIDHHTGFERYWSERIGDMAKIEFIGAACTLVFEFWRDADMLPQISQTSARLLICGILDNTLNFGANVTSPRDRAAYNQLLKRANLPNNWVKTYFADCEQAIRNNIEGAIDKDIKDIFFTSFGDNAITIAQMVLWDSDKFISENANKVRMFLDNRDNRWFLNAVSLKNKKSVFLASDNAVERWLSELLGVSFSDQIARSDRLWLRKEIIKHEALKAS